MERSKKKKLVILRKRGDFVRIQKAGRRLRLTPWLLLNYADNDLGMVRLGWTIPGKVSEAVTRNRVKRWCREYFREFLKVGPEKGIDLNVVVIGKDKVFLRNIRYSEFREALEKGCSRIFGNI